MFFSASPSTVFWLFFFFIQHCLVQYLFSPYSKDPYNLYLAHIFVFILYNITSSFTPT